MTATTFNFTTGSATLPDIGILAYNNVSFSPLFTTTVSGKVVKDEAHRTTKLMEYKLSVDGYVTTSTSGNDITFTMATLRRLLTEHGGSLRYKGRGFDLISVDGGGNNDVAWGPVPELIEFQPLGGGLSAKVKWDVTYRTYDGYKGTHLPRGFGLASQRPLLQFNYETSLTYNEDYYSGIVIKGTMEIPLTRKDNNLNNRTVLTSVDAVREELDARIFAGIDLSRFYVIRRNYNVSRDKRVMQFDIAVEEKAYMDMPPNCSVARGSYNVRPAKSGPGLVLWMCTLRATYTVAANMPRRWAWDSFLLLLKLRMGYSGFANVPRGDPRVQNPADIGPGLPLPTNPLEAFLNPIGIGPFVRNQRDNIERRFRAASTPPGAWLIDFSFDEGLYKDSKTITFSATWRMVTTLSHILLATGVWKKLSEKDVEGNNLWATSMSRVSGSESWLRNNIDPTQDIIIDFGY